MERLAAPLMALLVVLFGCADCASPACAQAPAIGRTETAARPATEPIQDPSPIVIAKELQGLDVFGSEGQLVGKIEKVNVLPDGKVRDVEVRSRGFLGFFSKTYVVPTDKLSKKGGRVDLSMTSEQAKRQAK
jgi:sporulation protein YlmC with PRC-barrel domain